MEQLGELSITTPFTDIISVPRPYERKGAPSCGIYLIAPKKFQIRLFGEQLRSAFAALNSSNYEKNMHALELQFPKIVRDKEREEATALVALCKRNGIVPIIRGDVGLCVESNAEGVILPSAEEVAQAQHILGPRAIIGVDCVNQQQAAKAALEAGVDYVSFSGFFSANPNKQAPLSLLEWWSSLTHLPAVAVGSVTGGRGITMVQAGAGFLGAGSWVWKYAKGPKQAVYWLQESIEKGVLPKPVN